MIQSILDKLINSNYEFIIFFIPFILLTIAILVLSKLIKVKFQNTNIGYNFIFIWGAIINVLFFSDFLGIPFSVVYFALILVTILFALYCLQKSRISIRSIFKFNLSLKLFIVWLIGLFIISIPIIYVFPKGTLITGYTVSNDSVAHSIFAKGYQVDRENNIISEAAKEYPRGFHSLVLYSDPILKGDIKDILLPILIVSFSFIIFSTFDIVSRYKSIKGLNRYLILLVPLVPFFLIATTYHLFVTQIAVIPLLITGLYTIFKSKFKTKFEVISFLVIFFAVLNIYGIYAVSILVLAGLLRLGYLLYKKQFHLPKQYFNKKFIIALIPLFIIFLPTIINTVQSIKSTIIAFMGRGEMFASSGNLPWGYLSPFLVTGIWSDGTYRETPGPFLIYCLLAVFAVQVVLISKLKKSYALKASLAISVLFLIISMVVFRSVYIQFKYLSFLTPFFVLVPCISLVLLFKNTQNKFLKLIPTLFIAVFIILATILPFKTYKRVPYLTQENEFSKLEYLNSEYIQKGSTLLLTVDDWFGYYMQQPDDFTPLTGYFPQYYENTELDYVIIDNLYDPEKTFAAYLLSHPELASTLDSTDENCIKKFEERFTIYSINCEI